MAQLDNRIAFNNNTYILDTYEQIDKIISSTDSLKALKLRIEILENKIKTIEEKQEKYKIMYGE